MRHTKIVATLGPATSSAATIDALVEAGADVFRLNFSHGTPETHADAVRHVRAAAARAGRRVAVLQDLAGPKIRTGPLAGGVPLALAEGEELRIAIGDAPGRPGRISTPFEGLTAARAGDRLLLDDGRIELRVTGVSDGEVATRVVHGGLLGERKGINAPGVPLPASALTARDVADLKVGLALGVDLVALSFVEAAGDLHRARAAMTASGGAPVPLIAKIERPRAVDNIDAILEACDGVMVARGDLGLELPLEEVPRIQKDLVRRARARALPAIVATQVFDSMRTEPRPTRAEVSDAANAVHEGADAIMLAGETAVGAFPVRAVATLGAVIEAAEAMPGEAPVPLAVDPTGTGHGRAICDAAVTLATGGHADAIIAVTRAGKTARLLSALRPAAPILAATPSDGVAARLALFRGVHPIVCDVGPPAAIAGQLRAAGAVAPASVVVFVSVSPDLSLDDANFLTLRRLA